MDKIFILLKNLNLNLIDTILINTQENMHVKPELLTVYSHMNVKPELLTVYSHMTIHQLPYQKSTYFFSLAPHTKSNQQHDSFLLTL